MGAAVALVLGGVAALAAGGADEALKAELKRLEGTWVLVSTERNGTKTFPPPEEWVFRGDRASVHVAANLVRPKNGEPRTFAPTDMNHWLTFDFRFDPTAKPKAVDEYSAYRGGLTTKDPLRGIYEIQGDTLRICYFMNRGGKRPTDFTAPEKSNRVIYILKRVQ